MAKLGEGCPKLGKITLHQFILDRTLFEIRIGARETLLNTLFLFGWLTIAVPISVFFFQFSLCFFNILNIKLHG